MRSAVSAGMLAAATVVLGAAQAATPGVGAAATVGPVLPGRDAAANASPSGASRAGVPRPVAVVRMTPPGSSPDSSMTDAAVRAAVEGASRFWSEETEGRVAFRLVSVSAWTPTRRACRDVAGLWREARRVAPEVPGGHLVVVLPGTLVADDGACPYGFGSLGARGGADEGGEGDTEGDGAVVLTALTPHLLAHELGHNLGLGHAGALDCGARSEGAWTGRAWRGCRVDEYDDLFEVMGYSGDGFGGGELGAAGLVRMGAGPGVVRTVRVTGAPRPTSTRVRLVPLAAHGAGVRVLRVLVPDEPAYLVEYRTPTGRDARVVAGSWRPSPGVRILRETADGASVELDATPGGRRYDRSLPPGATFVSHSGAVRITVAGQDARGVDVVVRLGGPSPSDG